MLGNGFRFWVSTRLLSSMNPRLFNMRNVLLALGWAQTHAVAIVQTFT